jgi:hypothetical protein
MLTNVKMEEADFQGWACLRAETLQRAGGMNRMLIFGSEQKKVSGFILDILCVPVESPRVSLRSMRFDDLPGVFPGACQTTICSGRFRKNRVIPECWIIQAINFGI